MALCLFGGRTQATNRVVRSTRVAIEDPDAEPAMRSPSQFAIQAQPGSHLVVSLGGPFTGQHFVANLTRSSQMCGSQFSS